MKIDMNGDVPIFFQVATFIENKILNNEFIEEEKVPSTTFFATEYKINPATALKGFNLLVDEDILYKKRGIGMFVKSGAKKFILQKRINNFSNNFVGKFVNEAKKIGVSKQDLVKLVENEYKKGEKI